MSSPRNGDSGVGVNPADLRADAETWREQSAALAALGRALQDLSIAPAQLGVFAAVVPAHERLVDKLSGACAAGAASAEQTGAWLHESAGQYEHADEDAARDIAAVEEGPR